MLVKKLNHRALFLGPCWAFATIGAIEGSNFIYTGKLVKLSEQQLIDCNDVNNYGMESGLTMEAFEYVKRCGGVASAAEYPYVAKQQRPHKHLTVCIVLNIIVLSYLCSIFCYLVAWYLSGSWLSYLFYLLFCRRI